MATLLSGSVQSPSNTQPTAVGQLAVALASQDLGNQVASAINNGSALAQSVNVGGFTKFTYTPPTSSTDVLTVSGIAVTVTFATSATQTVTNLKAQIAAIPALAALWTVTGTTTAVFTSTGAGQGATAISSAASHSASLALNSLGPSFIAVVLPAATTSTTLTGVLPGDFVVDVTTPGSSGVVATANTLPHAPTSMDVLFVLRPLPATPAATNFSF